MKRKKEIEKHCLWCGNQFFVKPYRKKRAKYCSLSCRAQWEQKNHSEVYPWKNQSGEDNPRYGVKITADHKQKILEGGKKYRETHPNWFNENGRVEGLEKWRKNHPFGHNNGKKFSLETRVKMSQAHIKRTRSIEQFKKQSSESADKLLEKIENYFGVKIEKEFEIEGKFYDAKFGNTLIEIDGTYFHSLAFVKDRDAVKNYIAEKNGFQLIRLPFDGGLKNVDENFQKMIETLSKVFVKP